MPPNPPSKARSPAQYIPQAIYALGGGRWGQNQQPSITPPSAC